MDWKLNDYKLKKTISYMYIDVNDSLLDIWKWYSFIYSNYGPIVQCKGPKNYFLIFFPARTCCFEAADMCQDNLCMRVVTISESHEKPFSAAVYAKDLQIVHWLRETLVTQATSRSIKFWSTYTKQVILAALILRYPDAKLNELSVCLVRRQWKNS